MSRVLLAPEMGLNIPIRYVYLFGARLIGVPLGMQKWALRGEKHLKLCEPLDIAEW